jgi:integrase
MASVRERANGTFSVLYRQGARQTSATFNNRKDADRLVLLMKTLGVERGLTAFAEEQPGRQRGTTLDQIAAEWFDSKRRDITPRALADYRRDYANWIQPTFGHREAANISELDVQAWVDHELAVLSPKTVADRHALLHGMLAWAAERKRGLIPHNPCKETHLPKRTKKPPKGLSLPEYLALRDAAYRIDEDAADLVVFMANTGLRIGEATAVQAGSLDDSGPKMYLSVERVNRKGEGIVLGAKSAAGLRRMRMLPEATAVLRRRLVGKGPSDLVFTNPHSPMQLWEPSTFRNRWWAKAVKEAGLEARKPTPHFLRHTHVLLCHAAGMTLPEIQRRIGHEDITTTINVYGRLIDDMSDEVEERLDAMLSGRSSVVLGEVVTQPAEPT